MVDWGGFIEVGNRIALTRVLVGLLLTTASCDALSNKEAEILGMCPPGPVRGEVDFLPLAVGDEWVFDYTTRFFTSSGLAGNSEGTWTWTFEAAGECSQGQRPYTIRTTLDYTTTFRDYYPPRSTTVTEMDTLVVQGDSVLFPFWPEPAPRFGPSAGPDTLGYNFRKPHLYGGSFVVLRSVRDRGLVWISRRNVDKMSESTRQYKRRNAQYSGTRSP
jgi:hypothetical protein